MASKVDIFNAALALLGSNPVTSPDDSSDQADSLRAFYGAVRDEVLRSYPWSCCTTEATLARMSSSPIFGRSYRYALPTDPYCLRVLRVYGTTLTGDADYELTGDDDGRYLECDLAECKIKYVGRVVEGRWDSLLVSAVAARLAAEVAFALNASSAHAGRMLELYEYRLARARAIDAAEYHNTNEIQDSWLTAREE